MNTEKVDIELAYLAGLFEGEGCALVTKNIYKKAPCGYRYDAIVTIAMTDFEPVDAFCKRWGGKVTKYYHQGNKPTYKWIKTGKQARVVALEIIPYIKSSRKRGALQCVIAYCDTLQITKRFSGISIELLQFREDIRGKCRAFNARGQNSNNRTEVEFKVISIMKLPSKQLELF